MKRWLRKKRTPGILVEKTFTLIWSYMTVSGSHSIFLRLRWPTIEFLMFDWDSEDVANPNKKKLPPGHQTNLANDQGMLKVTKLNLNSIPYNTRPLNISPDLEEEGLWDLPKDKESQLRFCFARSRAFSAGCSASMRRTRPWLELESCELTVDQWICI